MKQCFKCGEEKPRTEFYAHPMMADGLLGKCKVCARLDVKQRRRDPAVREKILAYDRERGNRQPPSYQEKVRERNPQAVKARTALSNAVRDGKVTRGTRCEHCGSSGSLHGHHHDYSRPFAVVWLCAACHRQLHALMDLVEKAMSQTEAA